MRPIYFTKQTKYKSLSTILILIFFFVACCNCNTTNNNISGIFPKNLQSIPRNSFVKIEMIINARICMDPKNPKSCVEGKMGGSGSGSIVAKDGTIGYVLTANHVCVLDTTAFPPQLEILNVEINALDIDSIKHKATVISTDAKNDMCILKVDDIKYDALKIAKQSPQIGERLINIAAPLGFALKNVVPIFDAIFIGDSEDVYKDRLIAIYTTHARPGSSGSMVINYNGELVGMIHSVIGAAPELAFSPSWKILKDFIDTSIKNSCPKCNLL